MSGLRDGSTPFFSSSSRVAGSSQVWTSRLTHLMKCSGVLPVGKEITPPG